MRYAAYCPELSAVPSLPNVNLPRRELRDATYAAGHGAFFPDAMYTVGADAAELVALMNVAADSIRGQWEFATAGQRRFCNWIAGLAQSVAA